MPSHCLEIHELDPSHTHTHTALLSAHCELWDLLIVPLGVSINSLNYWRKVLFPLSPVYVGVHPFL